jgi:LysR family transcriptional activator of nhaA
MRVQDTDGYRSGSAFGSEGQGVFMAPTEMERDTVEQFGVELIDCTEELVDEFYAVSVERCITHPCVVAITGAARGSYLGDNNQ